MAAPSYPTQPFPFLSWLASEVSLAGAPCGAAMYGTGGVLALVVPAGGGRLLWTPPGVATGPAFGVEGLPGNLVPVGIGGEAARDLGLALATVVRRFQPLPLAWGPPGDADEPVLFTPYSLGDLVCRQMTPGVTHWGPFVFLGLGQPSPRRIELAFRRAAGGKDPAVAFLLDLGAVDGDDGRRTGRRADLRLARAADDRTPDERRRPECQVERLVGFAIGRALGLDPIISLPPEPAVRSATAAGPVEVPAPGPDGPAPAPAEAQPARPSLARLLQRARFPFELGPDLFFRPWGDNFVSNELLLHSPGLGTIVCHSNRECLCAVIPSTGSDERYHCCPWPRGSEDPAGRLVTDFDDLAAVGGGHDRLDAAISRAVAGGGDRPVFVIEMCEYQAMGDDMEGVARKVREERGGRILTHDNVVSEGPLAHLDNRWAPFLSGALGNGEAGIDPAGVNLCGYFTADAPARAEVEALLAAVGVRVRGVAFPYVDPASVAALASASLWVVSPWAVVEKGLGAAVDGLGLKALRTPGPFGMDGTRRWVDAIATALGLPPLDAGRFESLVRPWQAAWEGVRARLAGRSAALVAPGAHLAEALGPAFFYGLDPVALLRDLGLRVFLVPTGQPGDACKDPGAIPDGVELILPAPGEPVSGTLRRAGCDLVYSDYATDARVLAAGAMPFGVRDLEPGPGGAVRTGQRILARCGTPFFRSYGHLVEGGGP